MNKNSPKTYKNRNLKSGKNGPKQEKKRPKTVTKADLTIKDQKLSINDCI